MSGIRWDSRKWEQALQGLAKDYEGATAQAAAGVAQRILHDAVMRPPTVPLQTGTLRGSSTFEIFAAASWRAVRIQVGFNTVYAAAVHEGGWKTGPLAGVRIRNWSEPGSGPKFLSAKLQAFRDDYIAQWGREVHKRLGMA